MPTVPIQAFLTIPLSGHSNLVSLSLEGGKQNKYYYCQYRALLRKDLKNKNCQRLRIFHEKPQTKKTSNCIFNIDSLAPLQTDRMFSRLRKDPELTFVWLIPILAGTYLRYGQFCRWVTLWDYDVCLCTRTYIKKPEQNYICPICLSRRLFLLFVCSLLKLSV